MPADSLSEHALFQITPQPHEIIHPVAMSNTSDILMNDRAFIEIAGGIMRGGPDELHATCMRLVIRSSAGESG